MMRIAPYEIETIISDEPWSVNCYVVCNPSSGRQLLIDPGGPTARIEEAVHSLGTGLDAILITHAHHDHVGALAEIQKIFDVPCYGHRADNRLLRQAHTYALVFAGHSMEPLSNVHLFEGEGPLVDGWSIKVWHTPGHSMGGVCYDFGSFVCTGDTLLYEHVGRTDTPGGNEPLLIESVDRLLAGLSVETLLLPGHGKSWAVGDARRWWHDVKAAPPQHKQFGGV